MKQQEIKRKQIICYTYVIGLLGMAGMGKILGDGGLACLAVALEGISLFTLTVTFGVSDVIARLQRNRRNKGQYRGAARMRGQFLLLQGIVGVLLSLFLFLLSDTLARKVFLVPYSVSAMRALAPVVLFQALDAALLGYFLGSGRYIPSLVSAVLRQGFFLVFGSLLGRRLADYGGKVSNLLKNNSYSGMYGALGVALAILLTELLVFLFLFVVYMVSDRKADEQRSSEGLRRTESMGDIIRVFCGALWQGTCTALLVLLPFVLGAVFYLRSAASLTPAPSGVSSLAAAVSTAPPDASSPATVAPTTTPDASSLATADPTTPDASSLATADPTTPDGSPLATTVPTTTPDVSSPDAAAPTTMPDAPSSATNVPTMTSGGNEGIRYASELTAEAAVAGYGSYFGRCFLLCAAILLLLTARCLSVYGRLQAAVRREDVRYTRDVASVGLHYVWVAGLYFSVTMAVMAPQIAAGFFQGDAGLAKLLRSGGILILLAGVVILLSMVLLAGGERLILMGMLGIWAVLSLVLRNMFVKSSGYSAAGILSGELTATAMLLAAMAAYCVWQSRINTEYIRILGIPLAGAGIMGLAMTLVTKLLGVHMGNVASVAVAALLGIIVYGCILVVTKNIREYEISILYGKQARKWLERIIS